MVEGIKTDNTKILVPKVEMIDHEGTLLFKNTERFNSMLFISYFLSFVIIQLFGDNCMTLKNRERERENCLYDILCYHNVSIVLIEERFYEISVSPGHPI